MKDFMCDWLLPEATKKALCYCPVSCLLVWELTLHLVDIFPGEALAPPECAAATRGQTQLAWRGISF